MIQPYLIHITRGTNNESFYALIQKYVSDGAILRWLFLALQFSIAMLSLLFSITSKRQVVHWSIGAIACFMFFAKFQSPQWILWISPLMLAALNQSSRAQFSLFTLMEALTYLYFPILFVFAHQNIRPASAFPEVLVLYHGTIAAIAIYYVRVAVRRRGDTAWGMVVR